MNRSAFPLGCFYSPGEEKERANREIEKGFSCWSEAVPLVPWSFLWRRLLILSMDHDVWFGHLVLPLSCLLTLRLTKQLMIEWRYIKHSLNSGISQVLTPLRVWRPVSKSLDAVAGSGTTGEDVSLDVVVVCQVCCNKVPQSGQLKPQKFVSQFCRLEVCGQDWFFPRAVREHLFHAPLQASGGLLPTFGIPYLVQASP